MKNLLIAIITIILFFGFNQIVFSQDDDFDSSSWDSYVDTYNQQQIQKPVTPQEFDKAVDTLKNQQKSGKKNKKGKANQEDAKQKDTSVDEDEQIPELPDSPYPLLRLPVSVYINNTVIRDGFYLIGVVNKEDKYYIRFNQGFKTIAEVDANVMDNAPKTSGASAEIQDNNTVRILYNNRGLVLKADLPIFKDEIPLFQD